MIISFMARGLSSTLCCCFENLSFDGRLIITKAHLLLGIFELSRFLLAYISYIKYFWLEESHNVTGTYADPTTHEFGQAKR